MAKARVKHNRLHFNGKNYFRGSSESLQLGSYGEKRTPIFGMNFLEEEGELRDLDSSNIEATVVDIDYDQTRTTDFFREDSGKIKGVDVSGGAIFSRNSFQEADLKLLKLEMNHGDLEDALNSDEDAVDDLKSMGGRARVVSAIWTVISADLAERITSSGGTSSKVKLEGTGSGEQKLTLNGNTNVSVKLEEGTTFAYLLASIDWDHRRRKKRKRIVDLDTDQWSIN